MKGCIHLPKPLSIHAQLEWYAISIIHNNIKYSRWEILSLLGSIQRNRLSSRAQTKKCLPFTWKKQKPFVLAKRNINIVLQQVVFASIILSVTSATVLWESVLASLKGLHVLHIKSVILVLPAVTNWNGPIIPIVYLYSRKVRIAWTIMSVKWIRNVGIRVKDMLQIKLNSVWLRTSCKMVQK